MVKVAPADEAKAPVLRVLLPPTEIVPAERVTAPTVPVVPVKARVPEPALVSVPVPLAMLPLTVTLPLFVVLPMVSAWLALLRPPLSVRLVPLLAVMSEAVATVTRLRYELLPVRFWIAPAPPPVPLMLERTPTTLMLALLASWANCSDVPLATVTPVP